MWGISKALPTSGQTITSAPDATLLAEAGN
jgi:hypothetical protein